MTLVCGENRLTGTANGLGFGLTQIQAADAAKKDAEANARATAQQIINRERCPGEVPGVPAEQKCPDRRVFDNTPINTQVLRGAAAPRRRRVVVWFFIIPIVITFWQAQASSDWDITIFCI